MGCSASRLDEKEEGKIPVIRLVFFGGRIKTKRQRQVWNVTVGLLGPEEDGKSHEKMATAAAETKEKDRGKRNKNVVARDEEELPRSPSFRVYFSEDAASKESDDDSVKVIRKIKEEETMDVSSVTVTLATHGRRRSVNQKGSNLVLTVNQRIGSSSGGRRDR